MTDDLDRIMQVMRIAFDPEFGEAWTRRQVEDSLLMPGTYYLLAGPSGAPPAPGEPTAGFALVRAVAGEEELLLLAVDPQWRGRGIATALLQRFFEAAEIRGSEGLFLEMRDGNPAAALYRKNGFQEVGRRRNYYRRGTGPALDAITFARPVRLTPWPQ